MSSCVWRVIGVTCTTQIHLVRLLNLWVERPLLWSTIRAHKLRLEWICHPHRGVGRFVVVGGVVALAICRNLQLYGVWIEIALILTWQLQPTLSWHATSYATICRTSSSRTTSILSRGRVRGRRGCTPSCSTTRRSR